MNATAPTRREDALVAFLAAHPGPREDALLDFEKWWTTAEAGGHLIVRHGEHRLILIPCAGCGRQLPEGEAGTVWVDTPLGLTTAKTHRDQDCARRAAANHREQPARRVPPPARRLERGRGESR